MSCCKAINRFSKLFSFFNIFSILLPDVESEDLRLVFREDMAMLLPGLSSPGTVYPGLILVKVNNSERTP